MDASGAMSSAIGQVFNKCPIIGDSVINPTCTDNTGTIVASGKKGTRPYQFSINGGAFQTDSIFSGLKGRFYKIILKDALGFEDSINVEIFNECIKLAVQTTNDTCSEALGAVNLNVTGGTAPYNFDIIYTDGYTIRNIPPYYEGLVKGTYEIVVTDSIGMKDSLSAIIFDEKSVLNLGNDTTLCAGQTLLLARIG